MNEYFFLLPSVFLLLILLGTIGYFTYRTYKKVEKAERILKNYASTTRQIITLLGRLNTENNSEKIEEIVGRIHQIEEDGDKMERQLQAIFHSSNWELFPTYIYSKINTVLILSNYLETLSDVVLKNAYIHLNRKNTHSYLTPKLRNFLFDFQENLVASCSEFIQNLNSETPSDSTKFNELEDKINLLHHQALEYLIKSLEKEEIKPISALYYKELVINYEIIGDLLYKSNKICIKNPLKLGII